MGDLKLNNDLRRYVESEIIPRYSSFDKAHKEDHAKSVIEEALRLAAQKLPVKTKFVVRRDYDSTVNA